MKIRVFSQVYQWLRSFFKWFVSWKGNKQYHHIAHKSEKNQRAIRSMSATVAAFHGHPMFALKNCVDVSNIFSFFPTSGNDPIGLAHIFQMGWNHQLESETIKKPLSCSKTSQIKDINPCIPLAHGPAYFRRKNDETWWYNPWDGEPHPAVWLPPPRLEPF